MTKEVRDTPASVPVKPATQGTVIGHGEAGEKAPRPIQGTGEKGQTESPSERAATSHEAGDTDAQGSSYR